MLGTKLCSRYKIVRHLGGGGFSQTFLAADEQLPGKPLCVVKQLKPKSSDPFTLQTARRLFDREAEVLYKLGNHEQIPRLLAHFEEGQEFYLVQEFIEGNELKQELQVHKQLSEIQVIALLQDILKILEFVHQQDVIHRDIKPANLIRRKQDGKIVLIDFGAVKQVSAQKVDSDGQSTLTIAIGSPGYMPNEQLGGKPLFCSDIYAIGMVGIQALTGFPPYKLPQDPKTSEIIWRKRSLPNTPRQPLPVSPELAEVLDKMVRYDYRQRYQTTTEALHALEQLVNANLSTAIPLDSQIPLTPSGATPESATVHWTPLPQVPPSQWGSTLEPTPPSVILTQAVSSPQQTPPASSANSSAPQVGSQAIDPCILKETIAGSSVFNEIVKYLEQHENSTRIKKLIFCAYTDQWENDLNILNNFKLQDLLVDLIEFNPTLDQLSSALYSVVQTLNRQEEYSLVAQTIISQLKRIYHTEENSTQIRFIKPGNFSSPGCSTLLVGEIISELEQDENATRIKKLFFCACKYQWENDLTILKNFKFQDLLKELIETYPTLDQLSSALYSIVQTLNRQTEYSLVANKIISKIGKLYDAQEESNPLISPPTETSATAVALASKQADNEKQKSNQNELSSTYDPFTVRLEVMKYTNPLRAKILVFSTLHHKFATRRREDWSAIEKHELDDLLSSLFRAYETIAELESKLYGIAECLEEPDESTQAASAIVQAMKPFYVTYSRS